MTVIEKQLTWVFTPTEVTGTVDQEFPFTVKAEECRSDIEWITGLDQLKYRGFTS